MYTSYLYDCQSSNNPQKEKINSLQICVHDDRGITQDKGILSSNVPVDIEGRVLKSEFIVLPYTKVIELLDDSMHEDNSVNTAKKFWRFCIHKGIPLCMNST